MVTYMLLARLSRNKHISVGSLGRIYFRKGFYVYVGSGSFKRIERHFRSEKKLRWHIDYFLRYAKPLDFIYFIHKAEHELPALIDGEAIARFGASDDPFNDSHLFRVRKFEGKLELFALKMQIQACRKCGLWKCRHNPVFGFGPADADVMLIGEAPGAKEDETGLPFVGACGQFLTKELEKFGINRHHLFLTGAVKCRPPGNRKPSSREIKACLPYLLKQIEIIDPKIIFLAGEVATNIFFPHTKVSQAAGKVIRKGRTYVIAPHPAAAMRFPKQRKLFERSLRVLKHEMSKL